MVLAFATACGGGDNGSNTTDGGTADAQADSASPDAFVPQNCDNLTRPTENARYLSHIPASEDFGFDKDGFLIGVSLDSNALIRTSYASGPPQTIAPNVTNNMFARATRQLPNGEIIVAVPERNEVMRYAANGSGTLLTNTVNDPNGIVIGDDGMIYLTAGSGSITRIDPSDDSVLTLHSEETTFDGITLSPDGTKLYFNQEEGTVQVLEIDENGAVGAPTPVTDITVEFLLDGMTTDACGNIYIVEMLGSIWRYSTDGVLEKWVTSNQLSPPPSLVPAVNFGSGVGGWKNTALYIMSFDGGVYEIDIGIEGRPTANR